MRTMETMKLIDLITKIANGEKLPKKILEYKYKELEENK